jgi:dolichyl-diphosphooligosaccharide---protein glycosyltransferase
MVKGNKILVKVRGFEFHHKHILIISVLAISFSTAFIMRSYPLKYGFYLHEYDPYFNYRATKYVLDHGINAYWKWHDTMSWYPEGRDVPKTSQSGLHLVTAFLYNVFGHGISLLDFTIILPVILSSLTTIIFFLVVRKISSTSAGLFAALLLAVSPAIVQRGSLGWFKSEPLGLFLGLLAVYLFLSAIKDTKFKYLLAKALFGGLILGVGIGTWNGVQYFSLPISLFLFAIPFIRKDTQYAMYAAIIFTIFTVISAAAFPRAGTLFPFGLSGILLIGGAVFFVISNFLKRLSQTETEKRNIIFLLIVFIVVALAIIASGLYYHPYRKYLAVINPFFGYLPIIKSVAEQTPPSVADYFINFSILLIFGGIGAWLSFKRRDEMAIFALIIGISGIYISTGFTRLLVFASIGIITLAAIGLQWIIRLVFEYKEFPAAATRPGAQETPKIKQKDLNNSKITINIAGSMSIILLLFTPMIYPQDINWISYVDIPPPIVNGDTGYAIKIHDWINALSWISKNTPRNAVIASWWDYGYWITVLGNRTTLADNATINKTRIETLAKMFMDTPEQGVKIARNLKANYLLIYVVAKSVPIDGTLYYYSLGNGGDESKIYWFTRLGNFNQNKYLEQDGFTPKPMFWNNTLLGNAIPFSPEGYMPVHNGQPIGNTIYKIYKPNTIAIYSKHIKKLQNDRYSNYQQQSSLVYLSDSFMDNNQGIVSAVLIYKINYNRFYLP